MLLPILQSLGGVASTRQLADHGIGDAEVRAAVRRGDVLRIRQGWLALPTADREVVAAVRVGGALTCTSLLTRLGVWCAPDPRLHVRVPQSTGHVGSPTERGRPLRPHDPVTIHRPAWGGSITSPVDGVVASLRNAMLCQERLDAIVSLDSALNKKLITMSMLSDLVAPLPAKCQALAKLVDPGAQSGLETKARVRLHGRRIRVRSQVEIAGVGRIDLLVGDRLVLELDGYQWHSSRTAFEDDRRRDLALKELGYIVIRLSYAQVMYDWPACETVILEIVRRREHMWRRGVRMGC
ncbi:type IV toxin-antitoxin system AbiEi family antitoxin domain-containing protein [Herbiconiux solani]|uniref:type IV toxin-antitoxin system AbiEi family antitoxin domain-containing protein n=1 Tax=Herbiconiux solani TaxID=661329 RepID=UPI00082646D8|nr:type IV toxin-antitoxin system AbiEi family antitoxin domain-containing protein [Herbiconiux solani]